MLPLLVPIMFLVVVVSLALMVAGAVLLGAWIVGAVVGTLVLAISLTMIAFTLLGRFIVLALFGRSGDDPPRDAHSARTQWIEARDGTQLHVEVEGQTSGPTVVLTHGWGADLTAWYYQR